MIQVYIFLVDTQKRAFSNELDGLVNITANYGESLDPIWAV